MRLNKQETADSGAEGGVVGETQEHQRGYSELNVTSAKSKQIHRTELRISLRRTEIVTD